MTLSAAEFLTPTELAEVRKRSDVRGIFLATHAWAVIFASMAAFALVPHPAVWAVGIVLVGARQLGLAILMHDAAHGVLTNNKRLNDRLAQWICAWPVLTDLYAYRKYHLQHHRFTQQANDPDLSLSAPFPITQRSLNRKVIRDLTGQTTFKQRVAQFRSAFSLKDGTFGQRMKKGFGRMGGPIATNVVLFAGLAAIGQWHIYFALWVLPFFTWFPMITRIRNIAEHAMVPDNDDPMRNARTTKANWVWRATVAPYWVNYHVEHHLLMFVPCYNLPKMHALLLAKGFGPRMEIQPDYMTMLAIATSKGAKAANNNEPAVRSADAESAAIAFNISSRADKSA
jgi:fatty acid desaturase